MTAKDLREDLIDAIESNPEAVAYLTAMLGGAFLGTVPSRVAKLAGKGHRARLAQLRKGGNPEILKQAANESAFKGGVEMGLGAGGGFIAVRTKKKKPVDYDAPRG